MFNRHFSDFTLLRKHVDEYASKDQTILWLNSREKINVSVGDEVVSIRKRGTFCCSTLTPGAIRNQKCPYKINFNYNKQRGVYELKPESSNLVHNHPVQMRMKVGEKELIHLEKELTTNQHYMITLLCTMQQSLPELLFHLNELYPDTIFDKRLILNMKKRILDDRFGTDRHDLPGLATLCTSIARKGGICEIVPDPDSLGIGAIHLQPKEWREYTTTFGADSPKMVDGTHATTQYKSTAIIWTSIDGLFHSYFDGVTYARTENSNPILEGASKFFNPIGSINCITNSKEASSHNLVDSRSSRISTIINPGTALITDEGPSFPGVADALGMSHMLDRKHFFNQVLPVCNHMPVHQQKQFSSVIRNILDATTSQEMESLLQQAKLEYHDDAKVNAFLKKISDNSSKLCWSYTSSMFTFAHISDQRSEGTNAAYKGNGKLKHILHNSTICQGINRFIQVAEYRELEKIKICKACREKNQPVSDQYLKLLNDSKIVANKISEVTKAPTRHDDLVYHVRRSHLDNELSTVTLKGTMQFRGNTVVCTV